MYTEREILKNWLAQLWESVSPKFVGQTSGTDWKLSQSLMLQY